MIQNANLKKWFHSVKNKKKNNLVKILGVEYAHLRLRNKDDLYVTVDGLPVIDHLKPENFWTDKKWFQKNSVRLSGTSCVYKITTKKINGKAKDIVMKWNRMGQDIPGAEDCEELMYAEFNSPFEEFSLVVELRGSFLDSSEKIVIQKPLAIYVPQETSELWQTGRKEYKMQAIMNSHKEIKLDMYRSYAVIYEWIDGLDVPQALDKGLLDKKYLKLLTCDSNNKMKRKGFVVKDNKPHHVIVKINRKKTARDNKNGEIPYGLIDFELLERTPKHKEKLKKEKRSDYLKRQKDRFNIDAPNKFHPHLHHINISDVDYVYGQVGSTKGRLWVVGKDPYLFDYFLPERWEKIPKIKISVFNEMYSTVTKDNIHLAWKVSKVGTRPDMDPFKEDEKKISQYGYNSPFEEVSIAVELSRKGIPTIYPRAIYMSEHKTEISSNFLDNSRYRRHEGSVTSDGLPILKKNRDYIIIWGYWNGPDEKLADKDGDYYEGINILQAYRENIITEKQYIDFLRMMKERLLQAGFEDLNLRGNHLLISFDGKKNIVANGDGIPEIRVCNFEFLKKI